MDNKRDLPPRLQQYVDQANALNHLAPTKPSDYNSNYDKVLNSLRKLLFEASKTLRYSPKNDVIILMPYWAIMLLREAYFQKDFNHFSGYQLRTGYENKIIMFHQLVSVYGKDQSLYHEVDVSHILPLIGTNQQQDSSKHAK